MKQFILVCTTVITLFILMGCDQAEPLENPNVEDFSVYYEADDYTILKRTEIDPSEVYYMYGLNLETADGSTGMVGHFEERHYMFLFEDEYYGIKEASTLDIFTCGDLIDQDIINED